MKHHVHCLSPHPRADHSLPADQCHACNPNGGLQNPRLCKIDFALDKGLIFMGIFCDALQGTIYKRECIFNLDCKFVAARSDNRTIPAVIPYAL